MMKVVLLVFKKEKEKKRRS